MSRPLRIEYPGALYHVMNRGRRREKVFLGDSDCELFLEVVKKTCSLFRFEILAYALIRNHYHLLIRTPRGNLSRGMRHINGVYTQKFNKKHKIDGSLFRGRYKSILVEEESYLLELIRYIHRNPYKAKLEETVGQYQWCSHKGYMSERHKSDFLDTELVLSKFGGYEEDARRELAAFVNKKVPKDLAKKLDSVRWPAILGGEEFKKGIKNKLKGKKIDRKEIPDYRQCEAKKSEKIQEEMNRILRMKKDVLQDKKSKKYAKERRAITYLMRKYYGKSLREIGEHMGGVSYVAISKQYKLAAEEIHINKGCYGELKRLVKRVKLQVKI